MTTFVTEQGDAKCVATVQNFVGGQFIPNGISLESDAWIDSFCPGTGKVWARIPNSGKEVIDSAVRSAKTAFPTWSNLSTDERANYLTKLADAIESKLDYLAEVESRDQGKPVWLARLIDIPRAVHNFRFFASAIKHYTNTSTVQQKPIAALNYTLRQPLGVAGLIAPWNLPLYLLTFKMAPCLAAGNVCVCKPSEFTSLTAYELCKIVQSVGFPAGVINMVFGTGPSAGEALVDHPDVRALSFTGSTAVGLHIKQRTAGTTKRLSLELGGKNAALIFADADISAAVATCIKSSFINQGEVCLCTSRILVEEAVFDVFLKEFVEAARKFTVGNPEVDSTKVGALISAQHREKVVRYVNLASTENATIQCGHGVDKINLDDVNKQGYFVAPTVITDVRLDSKLMKEEIFGPVTCVVPFSTAEDAIHIANDVDYGLCASIYTQNISRGHQVAAKLQVGTVWINGWLIRDLNMPFGGVKMSGEGSEGYPYSLDFYTDVKTVCVKL